MQDTLAVAAVATQPKQFFARSAIVMAVLVLLSFPMSYYLPVVTGTGRFQLLHHLHGLAFFAWFGVYVWQTRLAASGRIARHRELGLAGFALTGALIPLGYWMAQRAAENRMANGFAQPYEFSYFNLLDMSLFALAMGGAIRLVTRHREWHRRLAYVAALCLLAPAMTRWTLKLPLDPLLVDILVYVSIYPFLIALAWHDRKTLGRLHAATLASIAVLLPLHVSSAWIARSVWWNGGVGPWLFGTG